MKLRAEGGVGLRGRGCRRCGAGTGRRRPSGACAAAAACDTCCSERSKYGTPRRADGVDQRVGEVGRVQVEQPGPRPPARDRLDQRDDRRRRRARRVGPCRSRPGPGRRARSRGARAGRPRRGSTPRRGCAAARGSWDGAEPARAVAALGDLDVGPRRGRPAAGAGSAGRGWARAGRPTRRGLSARASTGHAEAGDRVDLGQRVGQLVAVALGHAAGDDQAGAARGAARRGRGSCRSTPGGRPR